MLFKSLRSFNGYNTIILSKSLVIIGQFIILQIWFIPGKIYKYLPFYKKYDIGIYFGNWIKFAFIIQCSNCFDLYFISAWLNEMEIESMTMATKLDHHKLCVFVDYC